jgi:hypothetical protein
MANNNQIELVVTVEVDKANQSIKSVNANLNSIETAATKSARAAATGIDGMTASMVKGATAGNLLADAIRKAIDTVKEWTIDAAKQAAQEDRATVVTRALAKAHGDGAAAAQKAVEAIREVGYTTATATTSVQKLIIADIGLDKAKGLAKIAKDAAAVSTEGIDAAEAFEKIMLAIETGQSRGLRTLSLFPDLAKAEQVARLEAELHGKTLDENEVKQIRYSAIVEAAKKIQDANAAAAGTAAGQMKAMGREIEELKDDIGKTFQEELKAVVGLLRGMVSFFGEHTDAISKFAKGTLVLAGVIATITAATKAWALAQGALNLAMAVNPAFLLAGGIIGAGAIIYKEYSDMKEGMEARYKQMETDALRRDVGSGKVKIDDLRKRGMTDDQIRELISGRKMIPGEESPWGDLGAGLPKLKIAGQPDPEDLKLQLEIRKKQRENAEYFKDQSIAATNAGKTGYAKDVADMNAEIARRTKFTDDRGTHTVPLTKSAWESIIDTMQKKLQAFKDHFALENKKTLADYLKDEEEKNRKEMEFEAKRYQERLKNDVDIAEKNLEHLRTVYAFEEQRAGFERDARLRQLDGVDAVTLQQKIAVEQQKAAIEIDYLTKVHEVKQALYDMDTRRMLLEEELNLTRLKYKADEIKARIAELTQQRQEIRDQGDEANDAAIRAARENAANRTSQLVRDHNRQIFDSLKQQAGGVFDALLTKSQSVWKAIGNSLKTALLTAIKEVVTSRVAATLMYMFTGQKVTFAGGGVGPGGSGGMLGGLGGLLGIGAVPVFGGTTGGWTPGAQTPPGGMAAVGGGMTQQQAAQIILGTAAGGGGAAAGGGGGVTSKAGVGVLANLKQSISGWKDMLTNLGNLGFKPERWSMDEAGNMTKIANAKGIGGMKGGVLLAAGAMLAMDGLRRGGKLGVAETTAGGAMIGAKFGGPLGAAIGAVAGFAAGMVRLFIKGAVEKARQKIKDLYGVDIPDKGVLQQIVDTAKQSYGGNLDMAIRTAQIRDLIQLYAMSTGQATKGMPATVHPLDLVQKGGSLYQSPGYSNGASLPGMDGLPTLDSIGGGVASGAGPVVIQLDGPATTSLLQGQAVQAIASNPRIVQSAVMSASKSNAGRRQMASLQLSPGLLTT